MIDYLFVSININLFKELHVACSFCLNMLHRPGLTLVTGGSSVGGLGAVADVAVALFDAPPSVVAETAGAAAVAGTTRAHPRRHLSPLLQVKAHAVDGQCPDAAQKASLLGCCSPWAEDRH